MISRCNIHIRKQVFDYLENRFGLSSDLFTGLELYDCGNGRISLGSQINLDRPTMVSSGILIARIDAGIKPTSNLFHYFGYLVNRNIVNLDRESSLLFLKGEDMDITDSQTDSTSDGYVLVRYGEFNLGCAFIKGRRLRNQLPKSKQLNVKFL